MKRALLVRKQTSDQGTFGVLTTGELSVFSGELPWRDNLPNLSCIPEGVYECVYTFSPRFKRRLYLVQGVQGRSGVRFHSANFMGASDKGYKYQLNGCIALGERRGVMDGQQALLLSAVAMRKFETEMGGLPFTLKVVNEFT